MNLNQWKICDGVNGNVNQRKVNEAIIMEACLNRKQTLLKYELVLNYIQNW